MLSHERQGPYRWQAHPGAARPLLLCAVLERKFLFFRNSGPQFEERGIHGVARAR